MSRPNDRSRFSLDSRDSRGMMGGDMSAGNGKNGAPKANGENGRGPGGRFTKGNPGGPGNPQSAAVAQLRKAMTECVTPDDMAAVWGKLVEAARVGEPWAVREILNRVHGKPAETVKIDGDMTLTAVDFFRQAALNARSLARN